MWHIHRDDRQLGRGEPSFFRIAGLLCEAGLRKQQRVSFFGPWYWLSGLLRQLWPLQFQLSLIGLWQNYDASAIGGEYQSHLDLRLLCVLVGQTCHGSKTRMKVQE